MYFRNGALLLFGLAPLAAQSVRDFPAGYRWDLLTIPQSSATAISNNGFLVGRALLNGRARGFIRNPAGVIQDVNHPDARDTRPEGVNSGGIVVGSYDDHAGRTHGFVRAANGTFTTFDFPNSQSTVLMGINDSLQVVGYFTDAMGESQILTFTDPTNPQVPVSLSPANRAYDIAPDGAIVGSYPGSTRYTGFIRNPGGSVAPFSSPCPGSVLGSLEPLAINGLFEVAGTCRHPVGPTEMVRSFLRLTSGKMLTIGGTAAVAAGDAPLSVAGINDAGEIAATFTRGAGELRAGVLIPCTATVSALPFQTIPASGGVITIGAAGAPGCHLNVGTPEETWATIARTSDTTFQIAVEPNTTSSPRRTSVFVAGVNVQVNQAATSCAFTLTGQTWFPASGGTGTINVNTSPGCAWTVSSPLWAVASPVSGIGSASINLGVTPNTTGVPRIGGVTIGERTLAITQAASADCTISASIEGPVPAIGGTTRMFITTGVPCPWGVSTNVPWVAIPPHTGVGSTTLLLTFTPNPNAEPRLATLTVSGVQYTVMQLGSSFGNARLRFVPVTPCRVADTRPEGGKSGAYGPPRMAAGTTREFNLAASGCGIPASARAYALNVTVAPAGFLGFLTAYPSGQPRPVSSTLNSWNGRVVANSTVVGAGANSTVSLFVTDATDVIIDVNGYFTAEAGLAFYPITPCRATELARVNAQATRSFNVRTPCGVPPGAQAYSINVTAVPPGPLGFLTVWPSGQARPAVSTLNSWDGQVVPNAAIVPAGTSGEVSVFASNDTDVLIDVNGYFAAPGAPGALLYNPVTPCRIVDTRDDVTLAVLLTRPFLISGRCGTASNARAYVLSATAIPSGFLAFATLWSMGEPRPPVSNLNSWNGQVVANMAIVGGTLGGIHTNVSHPADLVLDVMGYFAP
ncbi:MAG: hypothetical protein JNL98_29145 [Bryobacterales bacterium]|nr:hypothetical protein [Bryobacterales bacterium]